MLNKEFISSLTAAAAAVKPNEPMKNHTTFKIGGPADAYVEAANVDELKKVIALCRGNNIDYMIIGNGSNMLVSDRGIRGVVICPMGEFCNISFDGETAYVGAGVLLSKLGSALVGAGLSGLEFSAGIPGCVGGGIAMNAGAYGGSLSDRLVSVTYLDEDLTVKTKPCDELEFGYRHTFFTGKKCVVLSCEFKLSKGEPSEIRAKIDEHNAARRDKQPLEYPSAGSVFKRPEGYFAGKLIEDSGLKGYSIGGAQVSKKHAGFIINTGDATALDVLNLIKHIKDTVFKNFGIELEEEVRLVGEEEQA